MTTERPTFLTLPPELRNQIYTFALFDNDHDTAFSAKEVTINSASSVKKVVIDWFYSVHSLCKYSEGPRRRIQEALGQPALSCVCRQIRMEMLPMFYHGLTIEYELGQHECHQVMIDWAKAVGEANVKLTRGLIEREEKWIRESSRLCVCIEQFDGSEFAEMLFRYLG
jgi:hypothetical protein